MKLCLVNIVLMLIITSYKEMVVAELSGANCIYPVSHDREAPEWELHHIDDDFIRDDNATSKTCQDYCNEDERCRSALHIIHGDGRRYCYRFDITVQELKDSERYVEIYTETDANWVPTYITFDRDCAVCTYPVSHKGVLPTYYFIESHHSKNATAKYCQDQCSKDVKCRSVTYMLKNLGRYCYKFAISVQELKDIVGDNGFRKIELSTPSITFDRDCADPPSTTCSNTYPVSYDWILPLDVKYGIDLKRDDNATAETCKDWCSKDVNCRSVTYFKNSYRGNFCQKFSISIQELKNSGNYYDIFTHFYNSGFDTHILFTYDKQCAGHHPVKCSNSSYPVSHDKQYPHWRLFLTGLIIVNNTNATAKTCHDYCTEDERCRSVMYTIHSDGWRVCFKYTVSVQELKDKGIDNEIWTANTASVYHTVITYDRLCECPPGLEPSSYLVFGFCKTCSSGFFKPSKGNENCTKCVDGEVSEDKTSCDEVSPATKGPGTEEVHTGTNVAAIGEPMIVLIVMVGAGAVFVAPMLPVAEIVF